VTYLTYSTFRQALRLSVMPTKNSAAWRINATSSGKDPRTVQKYLYLFYITVVFHLLLSLIWPRKGRFTSENYQGGLKMRGLLGLSVSVPTLFTSAHSS
jgi:hypothetical protein